MDVYDVFVGVLYPHAPGNALLFESLAVVGAPLSAQGIGVLVGRDVLKKCLLCYNGQEASFTLAF
jgi:hypothetical protein